MAQDEATSVIFGMPAEAIKAGASSRFSASTTFIAAIEKQVLADSAATHQRERADATSRLPSKPRPCIREQIILFRVSGQLFAVSSASVQEVRSVDSLAGSATKFSARD